MNALVANAARPLQFRSGMRPAALLLAVVTTSCVEAGSTSSDLEAFDIVAPPVVLPGFQEPGLLAAFSGCLTFEDFVASNMGPAWQSLSTQASGNCVVCHGNGEFGFTASNDQELFFEMITGSAYQMTHYFTIDL